jgi:nucleoside phosphorylase
LRDRHSNLSPLAERLDCFLSSLTGTGDRFTAQTLAHQLDSSPERVQPVLDAACTVEVALLRRTDGVACAECSHFHTDEWIQERREDYGQANCEQCDHPIPQGPKATQYQLTDAVGAELEESRQADTTRDHLTAVMITALPLEADAVKAHLTNPQWEGRNGHQYLIGTFDAPDGGPIWTVAVHVCEMGTNAAAASTTEAVGEFKPEVAMFVGIAGGRKDVVLGDVVVASKVYGYHSGKSGDTFQPRPNAPEPTFKMRQYANRLIVDRQWQSRIVPPTEEHPRAVLGPIAAGEHVVVSTRSHTAELLDSIYSDTIAIEMEGVGFLEAVLRNPEVNSLVVRGISDLLDGKEQADATGSQLRGAAHAAAFAMELLAVYRPQR